ncbi:MAG: WbqC family protein [Candidatus Azobacteroides sp.]|nr:WbqC family protein [Candidatus Azobacteroides sp.]
MQPGSIVYLSTAYLAPVEYYMQMQAFSKTVIEKHCNYIKQTYRNRCVIASANGLQTLSIPVEKPETLKCLTKDIRIAEHGNWRHLHWNAIKSAYNSTPFFEYYEEEFIRFYEKRYDFLFDFNELLRETIVDLLDIKPEVGYSSEYKTDFLSNETDYRESIHPKKNPVITSFKPYYQVFESKFGFQPDLSIIDLLFNMGTESVLFL